MMKSVRFSLLGSVLMASLVAQSFAAQPASKITTPKEQFGFNLGDDYQLTNYTQLTDYWKKLAGQTDRMRLTTIGKTAEGRDQLMAIVTAPENFKSLDRYRDTTRKLSLGEGLTDEQAHALAKQGKAVVWIDGGLHATEVECAQALTEMVYQMVSRSDEETMRLLHDVVILFVQDNPDGQELVANWYMRNSDTMKRSTEGVPRLWHKYIGHDDNRDFFMSNMPESTNINRVLYREWYPQIMYNHHQTGPPGAVIFMPPFRDPFNYHFDPLIMMELDQVGSAMHSRMEAEGKPGAGMRSAATYSTWYNGGLRTSTYFHNMIGLLTEIIGNPTPIDIPLVPTTQLPHGDLPFPIAPQKWHFRQSIEYSITANRAVLDFASRYRETLLYNSYRMAKNSIERGDKDSWTVSPKRIEALRAAAAESKTGSTVEVSPLAAGPGGRDAVPAKLYETVLHDPALRDPRGYIIPVEQPDLPTTVVFLNTLIKNGVTVHRATSSFQVGGKTYSAGSYVVKCAQAYRPHVLDMFEPQDHPNDFRYPGGPPVPPYDATGYTLAFQMGVKFDRILDGFDGPFEKVNDLLAPPPGTMTGPADPAGYLISHRVNNSYILVNRLLKQNADVFWLKSAPAGVNAEEMGTGAIWVPASSSAKQVLTGAKPLGVNVVAVSKRPVGEAIKLKPIRIGLYDQYGGLMPAGWTRWLFEQYEFPFKVIYPQDLDAGDLAKSFDTIVFTDGAVRAPGTGRGAGFANRQPAPDTIPEEFRHWLGQITREKTIPQIRQFAEAGGAIVTIGSSSAALSSMLGLPVSSALVEQTSDGKTRQLPPEKFFIPGSLLTTSVDNTSPIAYGMPNQVDVFFDSSPVFRLKPDSGLKGTHPVAWFANATPLHSGWAWGQQYLDGGVAVAESSLGAGKVFLLGPEVAFRGQPHATFKFLFNGVLLGGAKDIQAAPTE